MCECVVIGSEIVKDRLPLPLDPSELGKAAVLDLVEVEFSCR
jgi:hypothetical protein